MEIIGLIGHQGVGKNYVAEKILPSILPPKNTVVLAFADHFKIDCITKYGADYNKVFGQKDYDTRKLLQTTGTEEGRNKYGDDIWIRTTHTWIQLLHSRGVERFVICDVRFENEAKWIKQLNGILIKIEAPKRYYDRVLQESSGNEEKMMNIREHPSEKFVDKIQLQDITVNNDPHEKINEQLATFFDIAFRNM